MHGLYRLYRLYGLNILGWLVSLILILREGLISRHDEPHLILPIVRVVLDDGLILVGFSVQDVEDALAGVGLDGVALVGVVPEGLSHQLEPAAGMLTAVGEDLGIVFDVVSLDAHAVVGALHHEGDLALVLVDVELLSGIASVCLEDELVAGLVDGQGFVLVLGSDDLVGSIGNRLELNRNLRKNWITSLILRNILWYILGWLVSLILILREGLISRHDEPHLILPIVRVVLDDGLILVGFSVQDVEDALAGVGLDGVALVGVVPEGLSHQLEPAAGMLTAVGEDLGIVFDVVSLDAHAVVGALHHEGDLALVLVDVELLSGIASVCLEDELVAGLVNGQGFALVLGSDDLVSSIGNRLELNRNLRKNWISTLISALIWYNWLNLVLILSCVLGGLRCRGYRPNKAISFSEGLLHNLCIIHRLSSFK